MTQVVSQSSDVEDPFSSTLLQDAKGNYCWIYELPMRKSFFLLYDIWKVLGISTLFVLLLMTIIDFYSGDGLTNFPANLLIMFGIFCFLILLSIPSYAIVTKANNGLYTVLFEMNDEGVSHTQIKTEKAKALDILTASFGAAIKKPTLTAFGLLNASGNSLYSSFAKVKSIKALPQQHLIRLDGFLMHNHIYVDEENFDFVYTYIVDHCPFANIR